MATRAFRMLTVSTEVTEPEYRNGNLTDSSGVLHRQLVCGSSSEHKVRFFLEIRSGPGDFLNGKRCWRAGQAAFA
ncbi:MAG TPA: hypothetical protein DIT89_07855 [Planctomycetaceae bacterium]|nr:hypothetical protein [Planctomycetaceae bacterium]